MRKVYLFVLVCIGSLLFSCATVDNKKSEKTSEIPDRREFPVNPKINACQDFFQHACSLAVDKFQLRKDRSRHIFSFDDSRERLLNAKKAYLKSLTTKKTFNEKSQQVHDNYVACMNQEARKLEEKELLQKETKKIMGFKTKKEFIDYLVNEALSGQSSHVSFGNSENLDNSDIYDFIIMPAQRASLPEKSYYANKELMKEFVTLVTEFFKLAGLDKPEQRAKWVAQFETDIMNNYPTPAEKRPLWSKRAYSTKADLLKYKNLRLEKLLAKVPSKTKIRNPMDKVFVFLDKAIKKYSLEELKSVYLFQVSDYLDEAYPQYFNRWFKFSNKYLGGPVKRSPLDERCTKSTMGRFSKEIDFDLFDQFFLNFPEQKFVNLLEQVRGSIIEGLEKNKWLSKKSKTSAIKKIRMAKFKVVKPKTEKEWDFNPMAGYDTRKYINNLKILRTKMQEREFKRLPKPVDKSLWHGAPLIVNAWYDPTANQFTMPAGILQYPFYDPKLPDWVNLGSVGAIVGHELGHGVDDEGSKYDEKGKVRQWMTKKDVETFKKRGEKLVTQFNAAGHNGQLTLGENIGDLVGVTFALNAAKKQMPLDPVARQKATKAFFLQYARAWCGVMRPKYAERLLKVDPHSLIYARVNEQMKHQSDFARVYSCKKEDKLFLPENQRISIW